MTLDRCRVWESPSDATARIEHGHDGQAWLTRRTVLGEAMTEVRGDETTAAGMLERWLAAPVADWCEVGSVGEVRVAGAAVPDEQVVRAPDDGDRAHGFGAEAAAA